MKASLFLASALCMLAGTLGSQKRVEAQPAVVCTTDPIRFGQIGSFELRGGYEGWTAGPPKWEYEWIVGACKTGFQPEAGAATTVSFKLSYPGTLKVKCSIEYDDGPGGHKRKFSPEALITVPPPDGIRIVSGDRVAKPFGQSNATIFQVTCQGADSLYFSCFAQERIRGYKYYGKGSPLDFEWVPLSSKAKGAEFFKMSDLGQIHEVKALPLLRAFRGLPAASTISTSHQDIRITIKDPCGNPMAPIELGDGYDVIQIKDTDNLQGGTYKNQYK